MGLLEYLMPRARYEVLRALRVEVGGITMRQLSHKTGVAYSSVHRELEQMKDVGLARTQRVGNAVVCTWNSESSAAKAMDTFFRASNERGAVHPSDDVVFWNLRRWGAPLARTGVKGEELSLESTLGYALNLARRHPDVARMWPVVFAKHRSKVDLDVLAHLSGRLGQKRTLGFFVALVRRLLNDQSLAPNEEALRDSRFKKTQDFFAVEESERANRLADLRTPEVAKGWHFRMNMPLESFESSFEKFVPKHETVRKQRDQHVPKGD